MGRNKEKTKITNHKESMNYHEFDARAVRQQPLTSVQLNVISVNDTGSASGRKIQKESLAEKVLYSL